MAGRLRGHPFPPPRAVSGIDRAGDLLPPGGGEAREGAILRSPSQSLKVDFAACSPVNAKARLCAWEARAPRI